MRAMACGTVRVNVTGASYCTAVTRPPDDSSDPISVIVIVIVDVDVDGDGDGDGATRQCRSERSEGAVTS
jgi:hypothetical protein